MEPPCLGAVFSLNASGGEEIAQNCQQLPRAPQARAPLHLSHPARDWGWHLPHAQAARCSSALPPCFLALKQHWGLACLFLPKLGRREALGSQEDNTSVSWSGCQEESQRRKWCVWHLALQAALGLFIRAEAAVGSRRFLGKGREGKAHVPRGRWGAGACLHTFAS